MKNPKAQPQAPVHPGVKNLADLKALEAITKASPKYQLRFVELFLEFIVKRPDLVTDSGKIMLISLLERALAALR